jgi:hypothetical protein
VHDHDPRHVSLWVKGRKTWRIRSSTVGYVSEEDETWSGDTQRYLPVVVGRDQVVGVKKAGEWYWVAH